MDAYRQNRAALRVLCVDDDELLLERTVHSLTRDADWEVLGFDTPRDALSYLRGQADIDVIVSDVMMPTMSGPDLYLACLNRAPELANRFIFLSGEVTNARRLLGVALRQVQVSEAPLLLQKPVSTETLLAAVAATVGQKAYAPFASVRRKRG